jgi:hypothetical protein
MRKNDRIVFYITLKRTEAKVREMIKLGLGGSLHEKVR